jgi:lipid A 4'-phosphatase
MIETLFIAWFFVRRLMLTARIVQRQAIVPNDGPKVLVLQHSHPVVGYLRLRRTRTILWLFLAISLLLVAFPGIDFGISKLFFDADFYMAGQGWTKLLHASVPWFIYGSLAAVAAVYVLNRLTGRLLWGIDGKRIGYLLLVLALGAGLVVNVMLKDGFGRARPRDVLEFGGAAPFTPAYVISSNCSRNCSFSSGDAAGAFFSLALVNALSRKRRVATSAAVGFGVLVSAARIASGSHFLSDTVVSYFVMLAFTDALYYRMYLFEPEALVAGPALLPAPVALISAAGKP